MPASIRLKWWGYRVRLTHNEVVSLMAFASSGAVSTAGAIAILTAGGVGAGPAAAAAALIVLIFLAYSFWIQSQDDGNGVVLAIGWNGVLFWVANP